MKKSKVFLPVLSSLALAFALVLTGCPKEADSPPPPPPAYAVVNAANLTGLVDAPVKDIPPDSTPVDTAQYSGPVVWQDLAGNAAGGYFAASTAYKALVTLTAKPGFTFQGVGADFFQYRGAASVKNAENSGTVTITFPATAAQGQDTTVNDLDLSGLITEPVTGAAPQASIPAQTQFTGTITWQTASGGGAGGYFAAFTVYKALVTLTAKPGFTFQGVGANAFHHTGADSASNTANS
ncbi:MAG: hypothetical protein LBD18_05820, partial [Treponema sp.]|nr:hypothetical protein [Treponema sp.]